ncbi:uncharacterized protein LOC110232161 [Exaiptasia diaphana]|uniref:Uncharacterized protein n=1 Tax=Exaiptasia diaphana TaxID=2652724 RepID=A0A913YE71_EXADI|nr:uncharacterized protein LOC110232161 [Exaiptasia diaphana]XP_020892937.1 uncharacterized protein LOC110232161 [Exaiptasia diaphana]XP_020892940.1 uncharacterized protein LOC110232161 [Exaiptasia diaphana]XP_028512831.1 uncharacterized protein LOC110232161 [Exaiptasia diaphana]XP_028512832.1 uncharacterized protein LOC110232161 [Exaiptasia diaphana]XP_028512833.1 uncharacterized protein LOC110232161 [Exaiptasia diaphana]
MSKLDAKTTPTGDKNIIKSSSTTTKKITSSRTVTKTVVSGSSRNTNLQQFKTSATQNIFSEKSWTSSLHDGKFGSTLQEEKTVQFETNSSETKRQDFKGGLNFDAQHALHLKQGARPKTTSSSLIRSSAINSKLDSGFDLHSDLHIPSSIHHPSSLNMKEVWEEGLTLFPEYFPDVFSGQSLRERFQHSVSTNIPVKETKLLSSSTKQYSWEKLDGDEEGEAQKIANSWLQIFGESEPKRKEGEQKAIKNS